MDAPQEVFYPEPQAETLLVSFRIISRHSWDDLQNWHEAFPGSCIEHILHGTYVLHILPGGGKGLGR